MDSISVSREKRYRSVFEVPANFFDACRLLSSSSALVSEAFENSDLPAIIETLEEANEGEEKSSKNGSAMPGWTCNTCKAEFDSLQNQRSHFKSDFHRINVKLSMAGKKILNEEDLDDFSSDTFKDYDISSISGSEDEADKTIIPRNDMRKGSIDSVKQKLLVRLQTGEKVSLWRCMVLNEFESITYENDKDVLFGHGKNEQCLKESEVVERLKSLIHEPRDKTHLRIVLLAGGGHFAGCVFDGNSVVAHKTFHRYVVRAKAGKKQSSKDAGGRAAHSAGASLRRYNELALKKDIQELLAAWKPYFDASTSVFIHSPSSNRQLLYDGDIAYFSHPNSFVRNVPLNVRRPTFKEVKHIYNQMTQVAFEADEKEFQPSTKESLLLTTTDDNCLESRNEGLKDGVNCSGVTGAPSILKKLSEPCISSESESESESEGNGVTTPLHEAAQSGNVHKVLELLEQGADPCVKDERGRTPYMLANEKEVRNTFRRFMALNPDRWDWHAAKVPSALTKEMEESQAAKQAEKDAKKKARVKELKKLRKAKEKAQAQASISRNTKAATESRAMPSLPIKGQSQQSGKTQLSKEEELKRAQAAEREKRAAAAERRMAAQSNPAANAGLPNDIICSCCNASLAGKVPFHRYNYKYCSTACMHLHREILEDG